jgi:hypothetical protein
MRSLALFVLILASLTLTASAQEHKKPKAKPYHAQSKHSEEKQSKTTGTDKKLAPETANSRELRHLEAQTAKTKTSGKAAKQQAHTARVLKTEHEKKNPPIHFSSATGAKSGMNNQGKNPYKGRVRQKGNKH